MQAREFLGKTDIPHQSLNAIDGGKGEEIHKKLGSPTVPSLVVDGKNYPIGHVSQIASVLGLPMPESSVGTLRLGWDIVSILDSWISLIEQMTFEQMMTPTKSRGRSIRLLTVNTFHPISLLPGAWEENTFEWHTREADARREAALTTAEEVVSFARNCLYPFQSFLMSKDDELEKADPPVQTAVRGEMQFSILMHAQRSHAAIHHRQIVDTMKSMGMSTENVLDVEGIADLTLPEALY
jgi:hypothetical protein